MKSKAGLPMTTFSSARSDCIPLRGDLHAVPNFDVTGNAHLTTNRQ